MRKRDPGWKEFGSGIRDGINSDPGSGINIPDPQHWFPGILRKEVVPFDIVADPNYMKKCLFLVRKAS
jgi:hypothetical protein